MKAFLRKFLPQGAWTHLKAITRYLDFTVLRIVARTQVTSTLYYTIISRSFWREHQAMASGRLIYLRDVQSREGNRYLLRRNIHRLEKGLIMRPRRPVFALAYISETVQSYSQRLAESQRCSDQTDCEELAWAVDVLDLYFTVTDSHPIIDAARQEFLEANKKTKLQRSDTMVIKAPYRRDLERPIPVAYEQLLELAHRRRSVRWFLAKTVPRELIDRAIILAALSPSACNRQSYVFHVFDNSDGNRVQEVAALALGTTGFYQNFPALIVLVGQQRAYFSERDRHIIYIDAALASMSFVFALETLGLSSCCINWPDVEEHERQMALLLRLQPDERVIMLIAVGYPDPDAMVPYSAKRALHMLRKYGGSRS
jgi:nitroreductase